LSNFTSGRFQIVSSLSTIAKLPECRAPNKNLVTAMPTILEQRDFDTWLSGKAGREVLQPAPENVLREWAISKRVSSTKDKADDPRLIDPI
jgi:putative SOS response-associated peptidase YedK